MTSGSRRHGTVVTGSIAFDTLVGHASDFGAALSGEHISASFLVNHLGVRPGGTGANIAYTLALLGGTPALCGAVGSDFESRARVLEGMGVDTSGLLVIDDVPTAHCYIATDAKGEQLTFFCPAAMAYSSRVHLPEADLLVVAPDDTAAMVFHCEKGAESGATVLFTPGQQVLALSKDEIRRTIAASDVVVANEFEWDKIAEAGLSIDSVAKRAVAIRTRGEAGVEVRQGSGVHALLAVDVEAVDVTGAGDAFLAGYCRGMEMGEDSVGCARRGVVAASFAVEQVGPQAHGIPEEEFARRYERRFGVTPPRIVNERR